MVARHHIYLIDLRDSAVYAGVENTEFDSGTAAQVIQIGICPGRAVGFGGYRPVVVRVGACQRLVGIVDLFSSIFCHELDVTVSTVCF